MEGHSAGCSGTPQVGRSDGLSLIPVRAHFPRRRAPARRGPERQETTALPLVWALAAQPVSFPCSPGVSPVLLFLPLSSLLHSWAGCLRVPQCLPSLQCLKTDSFFCLDLIQFMGPDIPADHETESIILHLAFLFFYPQYTWKCIPVLYFKKPCFYWKTFPGSSQSMSCPCQRL